MTTRFLYFLLLTILIVPVRSFSQDVEKSVTSGAGWFSLGGRSTLSTFDQDGTGLGTGGQFRIQLSNTVNTDWFADYITINISDKVRSDYYHIGWSVLYYPISKLRYPSPVQPYILAGHCFDYNRKTAIANPSNTKDRWGSAVQAGIGTHFNLSEKFDVSLTCQYMIHLTNELEAEMEEDAITIVQHNESALEGHMLTTISLNYKLFRLWKK